MCCRCRLQENETLYSTSCILDRYNLRKFSELPHHLISSGRTADLCTFVLFNYEWIHAKVSACPIAAVIEDFENAIRAIKDGKIKKQVSCNFKNYLKKNIRYYYEPFTQKIVISK